MRSAVVLEDRKAARWREFAASRSAIILYWLLWSAASLALLALTGAEPASPDDFMRLQQVRDLIGGQAWFDVTQYRMGPPDGASMHWSRLVDLPIAGAILLFSAVLPIGQAELAAMALVPLLYLLVALFALRAILAKLGLSAFALLGGLALLPLFPLMPGNFSPMQIDHHVPQAVLLLVSVALLLHGRSHRAALVAGALAAAAVAISLESLPLAAVLAGLYGLQYVITARRRFAWFLAALALAAPALSLATRPLSSLGAGHCDILLPGHMATFAAAAVIAMVIPVLPRQDRPTGRLAALLALPAICIPLALATLGSCAVSPLGTFDPRIDAYWYSYVLEGLPVWHQTGSVIAMLVWTLAILAAGVLLVRRKGLFSGDQGQAWLLLALVALAADLYALLVMRAALVGQLLTLPFAALLLTHFWPRARALKRLVPRLAASVACLLLVTPALPSALFKPLQARGASVSGAVASGGSCDFGRLDQLPPGTVLGTLDHAPEILARTSHAAVAGPYHRNQGAMLIAIESLSGDPRLARNLADRGDADYVALCLGAADTMFLAQRREDSLINALSQGRAPAWLEPVDGFEQGALRVWRVLR